MNGRIDAMKHEIENSIHKSGGGQLKILIPKYKILL